MKIGFAGSFCYNKGLQGMNSRIFRMAAASYRLTENEQITNIDIYDV